MIQAYRPVQEIEKLLRIRVTGVGLVDGNAETYFDLNSQPRKTVEEPWQVFQALRITGATLTGVELRNGNIYYALSGIEQARMPASFLQQSWHEHDGRLRALAGVRLAADGVDYDVQDGGRADVKHESEVLTLERVRVMGVKLTGAELDGGDVYYTLAAA